MAELRIGHDQIIFRIDRLKFDKGALLVTSSGYCDPGKVAKITGDQPIVIVCDDGSIYGAWHADFTERFREVRKHPPGHIVFHQRIESDRIYSREK